MQRDFSNWWADQSPEAKEWAREAKDLRREHRRRKNRATHALDLNCGEPWPFEDDAAAADWKAFVHGNDPKERLWERTRKGILLGRRGGWSQPGLEADMDDADQEDGENPDQDKHPEHGNDINLPDTAGATYIHGPTTEFLHAAIFFPGLIKASISQSGGYGTFGIFYDPNINMGVHLGGLVVFFFLFHDVLGLSVLIKTFDLASCALRRLPPAQGVGLWMRFIDPSYTKVLGIMYWDLEMVGSELVFGAGCNFNIGIQSCRSDWQTVLHRCFYLTFSALRRLSPAQCAHAWMCFLGFFYTEVLFIMFWVLKLVGSGMVFGMGHNFIIGTRCCWFDLWAELTMCFGLVSCALRRLPLAQRVSSWLPFFDYHSFTVFCTKFRGSGKVGSEQAFWVDHNFIIGIKCKSGLTEFIGSIIGTLILGFFIHSMVWAVDLGKLLANTSFLGFKMQTYKANAGLDICSPVLYLAAVSVMGHKLYNYIIGFLIHAMLLELYWDLGCNPNGSSGLKDWAKQCFWLHFVPTFKRLQFADGQS